MQNKSISSALSIRLTFEILDDLIDNIFDNKKSLKILLFGYLCDKDPKLGHKTNKLGHKLFSVKNIFQSILKNKYLLKYFSSANIQQIIDYLLWKPLYYYIQ